MCHVFLSQLSSSLAITGMQSSSNGASVTRTLAPSPHQTNWNRSSTGTPSPMSPTPSPAGSFSSQVRFLIFPLVSFVKHYSLLPKLTSDTLAIVFCAVIRHIYYIPCYHVTHCLLTYYSLFPILFSDILFLIPHPIIWMHYLFLILTYNTFFPILYTGILFLISSVIF